MPDSCHPMDCSPPGSSVHGISQVRILEWIAISFSRGSSGSRNRTLVSCIAGSLLHCSRFFTDWATREALLFLYNITNWYLYVLQNDYHRINLVNNICLLNIGKFFVVVVMKTFRIYFQICNIVLFTIVTMLYIVTPGLIYFTTGNLYLLAPI